MAFYVGQKVVCVDDRPNLDWQTPWLHNGHVYTISAVNFGVDPRGLFEGRQQILELIEAPGKPTGFAAARFRPIVERKTSIEIFKAMLNPSREEVSA